MTSQNQSSHDHRKIALITGASRGIGYASALELCRRGYIVVAVARTQAGLEELDDESKLLPGELVLVPADLRDGPGIAKLSSVIFERYGRLDALILNGAILGELMPVAQTEYQVWDEVMATNFGSTITFIKHYENLLRQAPAGRVVGVTSGIVRSLNAFWGAYAVSKAAMEAVLAIWAKELASTNIKVNLFDPGATATKMRAKAFPGEDSKKLMQPDKIAPMIADLCEDDVTESGMLFRADQMIK